MLSLEERDQLRRGISSAKDQIKKINAEIGQLLSRIDQLRAEISDENEIRRDWGQNKKFDLQIRRNLINLQASRDKLSIKIDALKAKREQLFEIKERLYKKLNDD